MKRRIDTGEIFAREFGSLLPRKKDKPVTVTRGTKFHLNKCGLASRCQAAQKNHLNKYVLYVYTEIVYVVRHGEDLLAPTGVDGSPR